MGHRVQFRVFELVKFVNSLGRKDTHNISINDGEFFYNQYAAKSDTSELFWATSRG